MLVSCARGGVEEEERLLKVQAGTDEGGDGMCDDGGIHNLVVVPASRLEARRGSCVWSRSAGSATNPVDDHDFGRSGRVIAVWQSCMVGELMCELRIELVCRPDELR
jgi:hypothetical protein